MLLEVVHHLRGDRDLQRHRRQRVVLVRPDLLAELPERDVEDLRQLAHLRVAARACRQAGRPDARPPSTTTFRTSTRPLRSTIVPRGRLDQSRAAAGSPPRPSRYLSGERIWSDHSLRKRTPNAMSAMPAEDGDAHRHPRRKEIRLLDLRIGREEARKRLAGASQDAHLRAERRGGRATRQQPPHDREDSATWRGD